MANSHIENIKHHIWKNHKRDNELLNQYINSQGKQEKDFTKKLTFTLLTELKNTELQSKFTETTKKILSM